MSALAVEKSRGESARTNIENAQELWKTEIQRVSTARTIEAILLSPDAG
jgi:hypothetical protein